MLLIFCYLQIFFVCDMWQAAWKGVLAEHQLSLDTASLWGAGLESDSKFLL